MADYKSVLRSIKKLPELEPRTHQLTGSPLDFGPRSLVRSDVVSVDVVGIPQWIRAEHGYERHIAQTAERGMKKALYYLLKETLEVTPIDTGDLRRSGGYETRGKGFNVRGIVYFTTDYAVFVHEDLTKTHKPPTMAKFLQYTQNRLVASGKLSQIIADECNKASIRGY